MLLRNRKKLAMGHSLWQEDTNFDRGESVVQFEFGFAQEIKGKLIFSTFAVYAVYMWFN